MRIEDLQAAYRITLEDAIEGWNSYKNLLEAQTSCDEAEKVIYRSCILEAEEMIADLEHRLLNLESVV